MWNGNAVAVRMFFLAASIVSIGGCDIGAAPEQAAKVARDAQQLQLPNGRYQIDPERNRVWSLTREGVFVYDVSRPERVAVSLPGWVWAGAPYSCLPDLALGPKGEAVITSDILPTLWRIDPDTLAVTVHPLVLDSDTDKDVGFSGLVYSSEHGTYFAASYNHGSLWRIDPLFRGAQKVALSAPLPEACALAVRPRTLQQRTSRLAGLCVGTPQGGWTIDFAPDQRSAYVRAASCADRLAQLHVFSFSDHRP
jgi:hypothetical protein